VRADDRVGYHLWYVIVELAQGISVWTGLILEDVAPKLDLRRRELFGARTVIRRPRVEKIVSRDTKVVIHKAKYGWNIRFAK
jgi:hypothetical protein